MAQYRKLRLAMIGGGRNAFIGSIHRLAFNMDGLAELVAGALSSDSENAKLSGRDLFLDEERIYTSYKDMLEIESAKCENERPDIICIVTPNHMHFEPAMMALDLGFHVAIDKPVTFDLEQAKQLAEKVNSTGKSLLLTHTYTGYPMVKQGRRMVLSGIFGKIRKIYVEYPQGWLSSPLENSGNAQAAWRTDPSKSGKAGAMGDIGTHAFNLAEYVSGLQVSKLCADISTVIEGRMLDDDGAVLLKFDNGASGVLVATQVAAGEENNVKIRVYGELGGIEWQQADANTLKVMRPDKAAEIYRTGTPYVSSFASHNSRAPAGHPEGYLEAFANHYRNFFLTINANMNGEIPKEEWLDYPGIEEGVRGMMFIDKVVESGKSAEKWINFE